MALLPLATVSDLEDWLGLEDMPVERATAVLVAASALAREEADKTWLNDAGTALVDVPDAVKMMVVRVAAQMWANPGGASQQSTGPFSVSYAREFLTDEDKRLLNKAQIHSGLWTLSTTRGDIETNSVYVDVVGSDEPLPVGMPW